MSRLSYDPASTLAVLIGMSRYQYTQREGGFMPIRPALYNVRDLKRALSDKRIIGLPEENILLLINKRNDEILEALERIVRDERYIGIDTLLLYYVGHGLKHRENRQFYLSAYNTNLNFLGETGISFEKIRSILIPSHIQTRIGIVDCCHSGMASLGSEGPADLEIKGSFLITSAAANEKPFFDERLQNTYFTKVLLDVLKKGVRIPRPAVQLDELFGEIVKDKSIQSTPQCFNLLEPSKAFHFFLNAKFTAVEADKYLKEGRFAEALDFYEALRAEKVEGLEAKISVCREKLYAGLIEKANQAYEKRNWEPALELYYEAYKIKNTAFVRDRIEECKRKPSAEPEVKEKPVILHFSADRTAIIEGMEVLLSWEVKEAGQLEINESIGPVSVKGERKVNPGSNRVYILRATNSSGTTEACLSVQVFPLPGLSFTEVPLPVFMSGAKPGLFFPEPPDLELLFTLPELFPWTDLLTGSPFDEVLSTTAFDDHPSILNLYTIYESIRRRSTGE